MTVEHSTEEVSCHMGFSRQERQCSLDKVKQTMFFACCDVRGKLLVEEIFLKYSQACLLINARYSLLQIKSQFALPGSKQKLNKKPFYSNLAK